MNFKEQLQAELSRQNMDFIAHCVGNDKKHFDEIIQIMLNEKGYLAARAAWVAEIVCLKYPGLVVPYIHNLIQALPEFNHPGSQRNTLKILSRCIIEDEDDLGTLIDVCFKWINEPEKTVAVKIFCMDILSKHLNIYPELAYELKSVIEDQFEKNSAGFKSRGRKTLKYLQKYINT
jgi:hypothetical protein